MVELIQNNKINFNRKAEAQHQQQNNNNLTMGNALWAYLKMVEGVK